LPRNAVESGAESIEEDNEPMEWHNGPTSLRLFGSEG